MRRGKVTIRRGCQVPRRAAASQRLHLFAQPQTATVTLESDEGRSLMPPERRLAPAQREAGEQAAWEDFKARLQTATTLGDALEIALTGPGPDRPGRKFHTNLGFFLSEFRSPVAAGSAELSLYRMLAEKLLEQPLGHEITTRLRAFIKSG